MSSAAAARRRWRWPQAGVPFRFLPGVTSGFAALAAAGIPRHHARHQQGGDPGHGPRRRRRRTTLDWAALARTGQPIVVYMGLKNLPDIAAALIAGGLAADTPAPSSWRRRRRASASSRDARPPSPSGCDAAGFGSPALIVIGGIVALRAGSRLPSRRDRHERPRLDHRRAALRLGQDQRHHRPVAGASRAAAWRSRGAKSGPDYIDPGFHAAATGRARRQPRQLGDGAGPARRAGRAARPKAPNCWSSRARWAFSTAFRRSPAAPARRPTWRGSIGLPVMLVLDVSGQSQTAAAVAKGFATYDRDVRIAGVILNRVASERHRRLAAEAIEAIGMPVVGAILRDPTLALPERHLGLVQAGEHAGPRTAFSTGSPTWWSARSTSTAILALAAPLGAGGAGACAGSAASRPAHRARATTPPSPSSTRMSPRTGAPPAPSWCRSRRSPTSRRRTTATSAGCPAAIRSCMPAGSPRRQRFRDGMRRFAATRPVHGECGGFMVLGEALEDADGATHRMLGLLGHATSFAKRKMNLGYRQARLLADCALGTAGETIRGHEFHYAQLTEAGDDEPLAEIADGQGRPLGAFGGRRGNVTGTFFHAIARG